MVRFATEFGTLNVPQEQVTFSEAEAPADPVAEIEAFMQDIDAAGSTPDGIDARMENVHQVYQAASNLIRSASLSLSQQMRLDEIALSAQLELGDLKRARKLALQGEMQEWADGLPKYEIGKGVGGGTGVGPQDGDWLDAVHQDMTAEAEAVNYDQIVAEQPEMLMHDLPPAVVGDQGAVQQIAEGYADNVAVGLEPVAASKFKTAFVTRVESVRRDALANLKTEMKREASIEVDNGPDEGLFL
jgi:hypothetical protein